jgi:hypothetical protein
MKLESLELKSLFRTVRTGYEAWTGLLIYGASFLFALEVTFIALKEINWLVLFFSGVAGTFINFLLSKKFPKKFPLWKGGFHIVLFFPPYSSFFMSIALFVFITHFFILDFQFVWGKSLQALPSVIEEIAFWFAAFLIAVGIIFLPPLLLLYQLTKRTKKITFPKLLLVSIFSIIIAYGIGILLDKVEFHTFSKKVISLVLGFLPFHWFYELFISSIFPIKSISMLFKKLPKIK